MNERRELNIDTIIFDVGNVLVDFDWKGYLDGFEFPRPVRDAVAAATFLSPQWDEMDQGLLADDAYLMRFIRNAPSYEREIRQVYENAADCIHARDYAVPFVRKCREQRYRTYILSNYSRYLFYETEHQMPFRKYMDGEIFSFQTGQIKPQPEIYHSLLEKYSISPKRALFMDDRQENLDTAASLGIHTLLFVSYEKALEDLQKMHLF
ncbi:MAG: HAD family phosphatase [Lachnospiraceae bacterium]|nr:HAD family phosphatase [Lachnospiraceae bacterium]